MLLITQKRIESVADTQPITSKSTAASHSLTQNAVILNLSLQVSFIKNDSYRVAEIMFTWTRDKDRHLWNKLF